LQVCCVLHTRTHVHTFFTALCDTFVCGGKDVFHVVHLQQREAWVLAGKGGWA